MLRRSNVGPLRRDVSKMQRQVAGAIIGSLLLSGCAGVKYAMDNYTGVDPVMFSAVGRSFMVYDKPTQDRMMISASVGDAFAQGVVRGGTWGVVSIADPAALFRDAADSYLVHTGRLNCKTEPATLVVEPQYEIRYHCPTGST